MEAVLDDPVHPDQPGQDHLHRGPPAAAGEDHPGRRLEAAADHRRGRRGRGSVDPGRQQDPRHLQRGRGQGPRLRRPPQGDAAATWRSSPAPRSSPRRSASSSTRPAWTCSAVPAESPSPRTTPRSSRAPAKVRGRHPVASRRSSAEIESTDSDWDREKLQERLAKLAGGVCRHQAPVPPPRWSLKETKHRHRGRGAQRQAPPSRRASSPVVAWPCSRPAASSRSWSWTATRPPVPRSSASAAGCALTQIAVNAALRATSWWRRSPQPGTPGQRPERRDR